MATLSTLIDDELINPLKKSRLDLNKTVEAFAKESGIRSAAVAQAEEGFYPNPLPSYLLAIGIQPGSPSEQEITEEYHHFQVQRRKLNGPLGVPRLTPNPSFTLDKHPLLTWRKQSNLSTYRFCACYCIHMPSVNNFEKNIINVGNMPPLAISIPLSQAGYDLDEFTEACLLHKSYLINRSRELNNLPPQN
jgi:hypothetical protein